MLQETRSTTSRPTRSRSRSALPPRSRRRPGSSVTTSLSPSAPGWAKAAELIGETTATIPAHEIDGLLPACARRARRNPAVCAAAERQARPRHRRAHPLLRGPRCAPGRAQRAHRCSDRCDDDDPHQRSRRDPRDLDPWDPRPDQRPHQPHRRLPARGRDLRRPHRPVFLAACADLAHSRSTRASTRACTASSAGPTTRPPPKCRWRRRSADTSSGCRPPSRPSPRRQAGMEVLGLSLITNLAAGIQTTPLSHAGGPRGRPRRRTRDQRSSRTDRGSAVTNNAGAEHILTAAQAWLRPGP